MRSPLAGRPTRKVRGYRPCSAPLLDPVDNPLRPIVHTLVHTLWNTPCG